MALVVPYCTLRRLDKIQTDQIIYNHALRESASESMFGIDPRHRIASPGCGPENKAVVADRDGEPIGFIVFSVQEAWNLAWIEFGFVFPEHRRHGVYTMLWHGLVDYARDLKLPSIRGGTNYNNKPLQAFAEKMGRVPVNINYAYIVPPRELTNGTQ